MDEDTKREIANLKQYFEMIIANNEERHQQTTESQREALKVALTSNDKRLDGMNEFRAALSDQAVRMITRAEFDSNKTVILEKAEQLKIEQDNKFDSVIKPIAHRLEQIGKPNWMVVISFLSVFFVMITGVWLVIGLKIDATVAPFQLGLAEETGSAAANGVLLRNLQLASSASSEADSSSRTDRVQLNDRIRALEGGVADAIGERRAQDGVLVAKLVEVETQFCSSDVVRNLMHANDLRLFAIMWHKIFPDSTLPTDNAYYPQICRNDAQTVINGRQ
jgi:hypothetical protein